MKTLFISTALATILIAAPAFAQSDQAPASPEPVAQDETAPEGAPAVEPAAVAAAGSFINEQAEGQHLASDWIGETVYNSADENLGDITDLLIDEDGSIHGIVLGVGGFLGIGKKWVGIPFEALRTTADENGAVTIFLDATAEQLEAALEFRTLADIEADRRAQEAIQQQETPGTDPLSPQQ
jgi:PRC-barrel domain